MSADEKLAALGITLPAAASPAGSYANASRSGVLMFLSGKAPPRADGKLPKGRFGAEFSTKDGYALARGAAIELLAVVKAELGSLDRVTQVVELQGFLNATPEFEEHPQVLDGASELLSEVFGDERGRHARSVLGASSLRSGVPIVLRMVVEVAS